MSSTAGGSEPSTLSPDAAFSVLGNETRIEILRTVGEAPGPISFTELRDEAGLSQGGRFNYHLDQLVGHFIRKTDDGYELTQAGQRIIQAVLSGVVTEAPVQELTEIDAGCQLCDAPIRVRYHEDRVEAFCTECAGLWGEEKRPSGDHIEGYLGRRLLPPAGLKNRTPADTYRTAWIWTFLEFIGISNDLCPACSATIDVDIAVCDEHDTRNGRCERCDRRYATLLKLSCANCVYAETATVPSYFATTDTELLGLMTDNGLNPVNPERIAEVQRVFSDFEEDIISTDPFEARYTFTVGDKSITFEVDQNLSVTEVSRRNI